MATYARRPENVIAAQWTGTASAALDAVLQGTVFTSDMIGRYGTKEEYLILLGGEPVPVGSWLIRNPDTGVVWVLPTASFNRLYVAL